MRRMVKIEIAPWCKGCPVCYNVCPAPVNVFELVDGVPKVARPEYCFACGLCAELCPAKAIILEDYEKPYHLPFGERVKSLVKKMI
ncbi:ferredoxin [Ignicoccus islandicus DSM 13165]|uniref:Ferredoxin n=2 Tax=Ignicoccus islandicus TaxID=54259 RepID=A0A0U3FNI5_9CREN|nr:ferredoxin [Ignicoccus islandicus DSM 13165]